MLTPLCQRWRGRRCTWRPAGEPFVAARYEVAPIPDDRTARAFVEREHYSHSYPAARFRFGLFAAGTLVGVAVFSVPMTAAALRPFAASEAVELGRLVLLDEVPGNAESWFVARAFSALRREGLAGVVSFSDPVPRRSVAGDLVLPGHVGTVYQALGAVYAGRATARTLRLLPDGTVFSDRAAQKIRAAERGWRYAAEQLVAHGAPEPGGADLRAWLPAALAATTRTARHPGNYRYLFALQRAARALLPPSLPYPRRAPGAATATRRSFACSSS